MAGEIPGSEDRVGVCGFASVQGYSESFGGGVSVEWEVGVLGWAELWGYGTACEGRAGGVCGWGGGEEGGYGLSGVGVASV